MTDDWSLDRFGLTDTENRRRFETLIVPRLLAGRPAREQPLAVVLVGQPGSGKTLTGQSIETLLGGARALIRADSDRFKPFHPDYEDLLGADDRRLGSATRHDGRLGMAQAQTYAREHRVDVLIDHTVDDLDYFRDTLGPYHQAGYRVAVFALAVPEATSRQGILERYLTQRAATGGGRLTIAAKAAASYTGLLTIAAAVETETLAHVTAVFRRGLGQATYNKARPDGTWKHPPGFAEALSSERARSLPADERESFTRTQRDLHTRMPPEFTTEFAPELDDIERLAAPLLSADTGTGPDTGRSADYLLERARAVAAQSFPRPITGYHLRRPGATTHRPRPGPAGPERGPGPEP